MTDLPRASAPSIVEIEPGGTFDLSIHPVTKRIGDSAIRMYAYNGSIPGPTLRVRQGSEILVRVKNDIEIDTTVHWHGLRLENEFDGVPHETQEPIPPGGSFTHRLQFPDAGVFWYHPHMREDYAQEMGLYGNIVVDPIDPRQWPEVHREVVLTLDDVLIEEGEMAPFDPHGPTYTAMGRFGNILLIGGEEEQRLSLERGEIVRFLLTNTANTRVFKVAIPRTRMKLVASDAGRYERETWADAIVLAPSERAIVDVLFEREGSFVMEHQTPGRVYPLVHIEVGSGAAAEPIAAFDELRADPEMAEWRNRIGSHLEVVPDKALALIAEMDFDDPNEGSATSYSCPMHPEVVQAMPGRCPKCGMKLMPSGDVPSDTPHHEHDPEPHASMHDSGHGHDHGGAMEDGVEWEDMMVDLNRTTTPKNMRWKLVDRDTGAENHAIDWRFRTGDRVKIRLINEMESDHPMHHPFHVHGQRFLILARDGVVEPNLVWKDTVLVRTGETVDILMDASNPGFWMAHCHIAEHSESGMMFSFRVSDASS